MTRSNIFLQAFVLSSFLINSAVADSTATIQYPLFQDGILTLPRVDTVEQAGRFQNVELQFIAANNTWILLNYKESIISPDKGIYIDKVETIVTDTSPVQVFAKVTGNLPSPCYSIGQINQRLVDSHFEIAIHSILLETLAACPAVLVFFEKIIPLEVYGLGAGHYEYQVNDGHTGSFSLSVENKL